MDKIMEEKKGKWITYHRIDGPAVIYRGGDKEWFEKGKLIKTN